MKKIILIGTVASSFYGFRSELVKMLLKKGYVIYAFTSEYTEDDLLKIKSLGAIPVTYDLNRGGLNPLSDIISTYKLSKKIREIKPDVVFSYFSKPVIFGTLAAKFAKTSNVFGMLEGLGYAFTEQPNGLTSKIRLIKYIQVLLYKISLPFLNKIIFLNPDDPRDLLERYNIQVKKTEVLGGIGLNLSNYSYEAVKNYNQALNFLFIGRLLKEKGIHEFVAAAKIVKSLYPTTTFTVLGAIDHSNLGALTQDELNELVDSGIIEYPGYVSNITDWIAKSHIFVLPSYREGVPRSTQEAMAIGRAVITTDVPGCRETVVNGLNGFLVPKWNPEALADKMIYFIKHPEQVEAMGIESHKIAIQKFDADKVNEKLIKILDL